MKLRPRISRAPATADQAERALAALEAGEGVYFGVEAGIAGLHPLQATLACAPALRLALWDDGLEAVALSSLGEALLADPALAAWRARLGRGRGKAPLVLARDFLACFEASADVLLIGALPFDVHRLAAGEPCGEAMGVLYFPERMLRRDGQGVWEEVMLSLGSIPDSRAQVDSRLRGNDETSVVPAQAGTHADDDLPPGAYADLVRRATTLLRERPLVSLTLSQSYRRRVAMPASEAFARLRQANPAPACFFLNDGSGMRLFGASPDLQLVVRAGEVQALPVCGTVARRPGAQGEAESLRELFNEEVDAASLAVVSDALRNDLAPLCEPGSLVLADRRRPMSLATLVHAVDRLAGRLRAGRDAWDAIAATAAPAMLTGTPRALAVQAIAELEPSPRGWYGGMLVQVAANGNALVGTLLRAACVRGGVAEVRAGGDLLAESDPAREEAESRLKARSVWRAFGLEGEGAAVGQAVQPPPPRLPQAVRLLAADDPFEAGLRDALAGLGVQLDERAEPWLLAGSGQALADRGVQGKAASVVAIGDAAYALLRAAGAPVEPVAAENGRALSCITEAGGPLPAGTRFTAARYARHRLAGEPGAGWQVWARDAEGKPVALARAGQVCLLYRPDSLLSDDTARQLWAWALSRLAS